MSALTNLAWEVAHSAAVVAGIRHVLRAPQPLSLEALLLLGEWAWEWCPPAEPQRGIQRAARCAALDRIFSEMIDGNEDAAMVAYTLMAAEGMEAELE